MLSNSELGIFNIMVKSYTK